MGTATVPTPVGRTPQRIGTRDQADVRVTMSASYATGGDTLKASALGMNAIAMGFVMPTGSGNYFEVVAQTDPSTCKIKAFAAGGAEVANATDLSALKPTAMFLGR